MRDELVYSPGGHARPRSDLEVLYLTGNAARRVFLLTLKLRRRPASAPTAFFEPVKRRNVRVIERSEDFVFSLGPHHALGVARECFRQNFQRQIAAQACIPRAVDLSHPTLHPAAQGFWRARVE